MSKKEKLLFVCFQIALKTGQKNYFFILSLKSAFYPKNFETFLGYPTFATQQQSRVPKMLFRVSNNYLNLLTQMQTLQAILIVMFLGLTLTSYTQERGRSFSPNYQGYYYLRTVFTGDQFSLESNDPASSYMVMLFAVKQIF